MYNSINRITMHSHCFHFFLSVCLFISFFLELAFETINKSMIDYDYDNDLRRIEFFFLQNKKFNDIL